MSSKYANFPDYWKISKSHEEKKSHKVSEWSIPDFFQVIHSETVSRKESRVDSSNYSSGISISKNCDFSENPCTFWQNTKPTPGCPCAKPSSESDGSTGRHPTSSNHVVKPLTPGNRVGRLGASVSTAAVSKNVSEHRSWSKSWLK